MSRVTLKKSLEIAATKERVWQVMTDDILTRQWYEAFGEGGFVETDWQVGSKVICIDATKSGLVGEIILNKAPDVVSIEYNGIMQDGREDHQSEDAKKMKGCIESYILTDTKTGTDLAISLDLPEEFLAQMSALWDKALVIIKSLAEQK